MPPVKQRSLIEDKTTDIYIGIDPGENGAVVGIQDSTVITIRVENSTEQDLYNSVLAITMGGTAMAFNNVFCYIEQQTPRPTNIMDPNTGKYRQTILASTCILYGRYMQARAFLTAASIPFDAIPPKRWQKGLHIPDRPKGLPQPKWKNMLKAKAQEIFPDEVVTLANADALLLAEFCRRSRREST